MISLRSFPIGQRLTLGFSILMALLLLSSGAGLYALIHVQNNLDQLLDQNIPQRSALRSITLGGQRAMLNVLLDTYVTSDADNKLFGDLIHNGLEISDRAINDLLQLTKNDANEHAKALEIQSALSTWRTGMNTAVEAALANRNDEARDKILKESEPEFIEINSKISALQSDTELVVSAQRADARALAKWSKRIVTALIVIAIAIGVLLAWLITRSIRDPIEASVQACRAVARGDLSAELREEPYNDEAAVLIRTFAEMRGMLNTFASELLCLASTHEEGFTDHRLPVEKFAGVYARLAEQINNLVNANIDITTKLADVLKHYANGDFSVDMPALPGKRAQLTEATADAKRNLLAIQEQILRQSELASHGDFSMRGDPERFKHAYATMVRNLNQLMDVNEKSLSDITRVLEATAQGDLTVKVESRYDGTFGELSHHTNHTIEQLGSIIRQIHEATSTISTASREINAGNSDLSSRTEQQAASLEETASTMEELTAAIKRTADAARQASQLADEATKIAATGGELAGKTIETMAGINSSSKKIADIISVIDGIAFQTNILALNAAVEAARAGEQGRGFAVVAAEVRSLAQRSAQAAREIKQIISDSLLKVEEGSQVVGQTGATIEQIVASIQRVTALISEIAGASHEQSAGMEQVALSVTQMDQSTQQNAAMVEQIAASAKLMDEQVQQLLESISTMRVNGTQDLRSRDASEPSANTQSLSPQELAALGEEKAENWDRRSSNRSKNVSRIFGVSSETGRRVAVRGNEESDYWTEM